MLKETIFTNSVRKLKSQTEKRKREPVNRKINSSTDREKAANRANKKTKNRDGSRIREEPVAENLEEGEKIQKKHRKEVEPENNREATVSKRKNL